MASPTKPKNGMTLTQIAKERTMMQQVILIALLFLAPVAVCFVANMIEDQQ